MLRFVNLISLNNRLTLAAPFCEPFPALARALGGKWCAADKTWGFDVRDAERVAALLARVYCDDGRPVEEITELVTVRFEVKDLYGEQSLEIGGVEVFHRYARDSRVKVHHVVVTEGGFSASGGSVKNPKLSMIGDLLAFELRDIPAHVGDAMIKKYNGSESGWIAASIIARAPRVAAEASNTPAGASEEAREGSGLEEEASAAEEGVSAAEEEARQHKLDTLALLASGVTAEEVEQARATFRDLARRAQREGFPLDHVLHALGELRAAFEEVYGAEEEAPANKRGGGGKARARVKVTQQEMFTVAHGAQLDLV